MTERGFPARLVERVEDRLERLVERAGMTYRGYETAPDTTLGATPYADMDTAGISGARDDGDLRIFLTEMPRLRGRSVIVAESDTEQRAIVVSTTALGPRPARALIDCIAGWLDDAQSPRRRWAPQTAGTTTYLVAGGAGRARLVLGLVRSNRPWRLIPTLTGMTAAAAAAASFGIFFSSIWAMSQALPWWRLAIITTLSVVLASLWLIVNNRLWERAGLDRWKRRLYNTVTACTVVFSALTLYAGLFVAILAAALIVIDRGFLAEQTGTDAGFAAYVHLAWLASSLGMFAGAVGSSADSYDDVLRATYGHRERLRRRASSPDAADQE